MPHYNINDIYSQLNVNAKSSLKSTPERDLPIFINKTDIKDAYDQIIVGGGISGLYAAYKILKEKKSKNERCSILIIEQSKRTGGRLDTDLFLIDKNLLKEEEGGMRFTFEDMPQLMNLFVELGLDKDIVPFPMHLDDNNRMLYRGRTFSRRESKRNNYKVWSDLYGLKNNEKGINPSDIIPQQVYASIIEADENKEAKNILDELNKAHKSNLTNNQAPFIPSYEGIEISAPGIWQFFRLTFKWKGIELYKWTLWSLLADMGYSNECIQMMARVSGFNGTYFSMMNAGEAFQLLMEFPAEPDFKSLRYGFSQLTNALVDKLSEFNKEQHRVVDIVLQTKVIRIEGNSVVINTPNVYDFFDDINPILQSIVDERNAETIKEIHREIIGFINAKEFDSESAISSLDHILQCINEAACNSLLDIPSLIEKYKKILAYSDSEQTIHFTTSILALPRVAIEKLVNASPSIVTKEQALWKTLESTSNQPLAKINLYYDKAWWNSGNTPNASVTFGPSFTDIPLGSVYPFYSDDKILSKISGQLQLLRVKISRDDYQEMTSDTEKNDDKQELHRLEEELIKKMSEVYSKPAALTIYCDYQNINFWQGFAKTLTKNNAYPQSDRVMQITDLNKNEPLESKTTSIKPQYITPASEYMVTAITDYFQQLFQTNNVPKPIATSVRIWEGSQSLKTDAYGNFGYGVHQWGVGAKDDEVINTMIRPFGNLPIYTCGEAYSDFQGWVEGALRSANLMLKKLDEKIDTGIHGIIEINGKEEKYDNEKSLLDLLRRKYDGMLHS